MKCEAFFSFSRAQLFRLDSLSHWIVASTICLVAGLSSRSALGQDQNWQSFTNSLAGGSSITVSALALADTNVYVGGDFTSAGGASVNRIARWDGANWHALGTGSSNGCDLPVLAIAVSPAGQMYAGGNFSQAGGVSASRVAQWNGTNWAPLAGGVTSDGSIDALACAPNGDLYAGGSFSSFGGVSANNLARWDGTNWWDVGGGSPKVRWAPS